MIKRTLFFSQPAYLSMQNKQLFIRLMDEDRQEKRVPIEDIGYLILEHPQITLTNALLRELAFNKTAVITCDRQHLPCSFLQPLIGHTQQTERVHHQINISQPLKKQLWQQTVKAKIANQALHLDMRQKNSLKLKRWFSQVKSGDSEYHEAYAAAYYFQHIFNIQGFSRNQKGMPPNNLLNYGYAILRAVAARAVVSTGLLPSFGIFHHNKYNPFALADDVMEPYRPFVDLLVHDLVETGESLEQLNKVIKSILLKIPAMDVIIDGKSSPLMNAMSRTTNSLYECFEGSSRKILYPEMSVDI